MNAGPGVSVIGIALLLALLGVGGFVIWVVFLRRRESESPRPRSTWVGGGLAILLLVILVGLAYAHFRRPISPHGPPLVVVSAPGLEIFAGGHPPVRDEIELTARVALDGIPGEATLEETLELLYPEAEQLQGEMIATTNHKHAIDHRTGRFLLRHPDGVLDSLVLIRLARLGEDAGQHFLLRARAPERGHRILRLVRSGRSLPKGTSLSWLTRRSDPGEYFYLLELLPADEHDRFGPGDRWRVDELGEAPR